MPEIKIQHVVSVSSEDKHFPAENLLKQDGFKKWKCVAGEKQAVVVFQFEKAVEVKQIDIGNEGSAFIEVLVSKSTSTEDDYEVILVASSFMSPAEARSNQNPNRVRIFSSDQLSQAVINQKWDRAKVICTQPFNKSSHYGLSFIKFHSSGESGTAAGDVKQSENVKAESLGAFKLRTEVESGLIRTGSIFEKIKSKTESVVPATGPAAIRAASKMAEQSTSSLAHQQTGNIAEIENRQGSKANAEHRTDKNVNKEKSREVEERSTDNKNVNKEKSRKTEERLTSSPPPTKKSRLETSSSQKTKPFERLMSDVVFTLSGFQNPERSDLRDAALEMGAKFKPDWIDGCTHLVCAFEGTPKYEQVSGKGIIVKKSWITECHSQKKLLPWRKYRLGRAPTPDIGNSDTDENLDTVTVKQKNGGEKNDELVSNKADVIKEFTTTTSSKPAKNIEPADSKSGPTASKDKSDEEWDPFEDDIGIHSDCDTEEEIRRFEENQSRKTTASATSAAAAATLSAPSPSQCVATQIGNNGNDDVYNVSTDEEQSHVHNGKTDQAVDDDGFPVLPDFMSGKTFFLYGKLLDRRSIIRYITAYNGILADYMSDTVKYVITDSEWDESFDEALSDNPDLVFIRSSWIVACHVSQKLLPHQKYAVVAAA